MKTERAADPAATLRAMVAKHDLRIYRVGADARVHPSRLSQYLHGRIPLPADIAERIRRAIEEAAAK